MESFPTLVPFDFKRLHRPLQISALVAVVFALVAVLSCVLQLWPQLKKERELRQDLFAYASSLGKSEEAPSDVQLFRGIQNVARQRGVYLPFENILIKRVFKTVVGSQKKFARQISGPDKKHDTTRGNTFEEVAEIGYAFPMELWLLEPSTRALVVVRSFPITN